ncbi:HNH endonuclease [Providencia sp. 21OH12SH02B-Prov]|uniref:HNH endonuclease n=1 Tax=unclassified Providencia TaxID=2633465 RepID=UPI0022B60700|nr:MULTISPECIES: HNH endonuclease [unclassified Providencia]WBA55420.1 HNH endonuclease [Providencia sp. 21OH12SH02B-Prov]
MIYSILNEICQYRASIPDPIVSSSDFAKKAKILLNKLKNELESIVDGSQFSIKISSGVGNFPVVWHVCLLPKAQKVSNGIYVAICIDKYGRGAVIGCGESKTTPKGLPIVIRKNKNSKLDLDVDGGGKNTQYNNVFCNPESFYVKKKPTDHDDKLLIEHIKNSMEIAGFFIKKLESKEIVYNPDNKTTTLEFSALALPDNIPDKVKLGLESSNDKNLDMPSKEYVLRSILQRRGQGLFREKLLLAYKNKCAVTGCQFQEILEAAHIQAYSEVGQEGNTINNGILLRADIHTLFDLGLLKINENYTVELSNDLSQIDDYKNYQGKKINLPINKDDRPCKLKLAEKYKKYK